MSKQESQSSRESGPKIGSIEAIAFTTSSAATDLAALTRIAGYDKQLVSLISTVAVYYAWGGSGDAVDETDTTTDAQCALLPANTLIREFAGGTHIVLKGTGAGTLRMWVSSR